jgi:hypothetical protein
MKLRERSKEQRLPHFAHRVNVKVEVVLGGQNSPQHLPRNQQVANVASGISPADRTLTSGIKRRFIPRVPRVLDYHLTLRSEGTAVARIPSGHDAIEHVDSARHAFH